MVGNPSSHGAVLLCRGSGTGRLRLGSLHSSSKAAVSWVVKNWISSCFHHINLSTVWWACLWIPWAVGYSTSVVEVYSFTTAKLYNKYFEQSVLKWISRLWMVVKRCLLYPTILQIAWVYELSRKFWKRLNRYRLLNWTPFDKPHAMNDCVTVDHSSKMPVVRRIVLVLTAW